MNIAARLTVWGVAGVLGWRVLETMIPPMVGMMLGLLAIAFKIALVIGVIFLILNLLKKKDRDTEE